VVRQHHRLGERIVAPQDKMTPVLAANAKSDTLEGLHDLVS